MVFVPQMAIVYLDPDGFFRFEIIIIYYELAFMNLHYDLDFFRGFFED